jgi:hypothetical protein
MHPNNDASDVSLVTVTWCCFASSGWANDEDPDPVGHQHKYFPNKLFSGCITEHKDAPSYSAGLLASEAAKFDKPPQQVQQQRQQVYMAGLLLLCAHDQANVIMYPRSARYTIAATLGVSQQTRTQS